MSWAQARTWRQVVALLARTPCAGARGFTEIRPFWIAPDT